MRETDLEEIERCRRQLAEVVLEHKGNLLHPNVIRASQQLDSYIVGYQNAQLLSSV